MGGAKAIHLLSKTLDSNSHNEWEAWKKVCDVTTYTEDKVCLAIKRAKVWQAIDEVSKLMENI